MSKPSSITPKVTWSGRRARPPHHASKWDYTSVQGCSLLHVTSYWQWQPSHLHARFKGICKCDASQCDETTLYRNVCDLDSKAMPVHGLIKDMVVHLVASPYISTIMDILIVDLPPSYGMLPSCKFSASPNGTIQMHLSFASIPNPKGRLVKILKGPKKPVHVEKFSEQGNWIGRLCKWFMCLIPMRVSLILRMISG